MLMPINKMASDPHTRTHTDTVPISCLHLVIEFSIIDRNVYKEFEFQKIIPIHIMNETYKYLIYSIHFSKKNISNELTFVR